MRQTTVQTFATYFGSEITAMSNLVTTGALNSGTIATGFGAIDNGTSNVTTGGLLSLDTDADADDNTADSSAGRLGIGVDGDLSLYHNTNSYIVNKTGNLILHTETDDADIVFTGEDGSSGITALTLDMSDAGTAIFNHDISVPDNGIVKVGTGDDIRIYHDGTNSYIDNHTGLLTLRINGTENAVQATVNGSVALMYDGSQKFATSAVGVTVTGTAIATTDTDTSNTGNVTLDFGANQNFVLTLTGNTTLVNPSTEQVGQSGFIAFIQDGTGSRTVSLGTDYETAASAGLTLTSTASATDLVPYLVVASGRILLGTPQLAFG